VREREREREREMEGGSVEIARAEPEEAQLLKELSSKKTEIIISGKSHKTN
jgi:glucokinase